MICSAEGTVTALLPHGFRIATADGGEVEVYTLTPGTKLALTVGDNVRVLGGPSSKGNGLACSTILRRDAEGEMTRIPDWPPGSR
jgi:hypothetical protein